MEAQKDFRDLLELLNAHICGRNQNSYRIRIFSARKAKRKEMNQYEGYVI
jgi:uncharacterized DUF497 family protein